MTNFKTKKIKQARKKAKMSRAELVREIQKEVPTCSPQLVYLWETRGVTPSEHYQKIITNLFVEVEFYSARPHLGLKTR